MPLVRCLSFPGIRCWFWSDDHDPPHFHAKRAGEWELRVNFLEDGDRLFQRIWVKKRIPGKVLREIRTIVLEQREALLLEWEATRETN
jgi:hypothetical protein